MQPELPLSIDPERLARRGETLSGQYNLGNMLRLEGLLHDRTGTVFFLLNFSFDDVHGISFIRGNIQSRVKLQCQRCFGTMFLDIDAPVYLGMANATEAEIELPDDCEPVTNSSGTVSLQDLIEDELILAIPIAPVHPAQTCKASELINDLNRQAKTSPFSVLKNLAKNSTNEGD